ncbi:CDP-alcohol phosphatidyltransferase family protein [Aestuariibius sp. 2305UL40-4]|uniref:CDP-alcohol phosphatidyltransferase family protein n=1 Tax=Aestuariibius violaceus TaxID=3234132 RepID=UPI00345E80B1
MFDPEKTGRRKALAVHFLTASGAVFAMLALLAAVERHWDEMFLWLVVAFVVDGIDGPLARRYDVKHKAARFDGVLLDLIIDYLTYVFIPAYALYGSGLMDGWSGWLAIILITFASALYFADTRMKTRDNSFHGFPGCWNMAVLVLFAVAPPWWVCLGVVTVLAVAMFLPVKFVHPVRTKRWKGLTLPVAVLWTALAGWAAWHGFEVSGLAVSLLVLASLYLVSAGAVQQVLDRREGVLRRAG